jgi:hypothetical protein
VKNKEAGAVPRRTKATKIKQNLKCQKELGGKTRKPIFYGNQKVI